LLGLVLGVGLVGLGFRVGSVGLLLGLVELVVGLGHRCSQMVQRVHVNPHRVLETLNQSIANLQDVT